MFTSILGFTTSRYQHAQINASAKQLVTQQLMLGDLMEEQMRIIVESRSMLETMQRMNARFEAALHQEEGTSLDLGLQ